MPTRSTADFYPAPGTNDCRDCFWFDGMTGSAALCSNPKCCRVRSQPENGCTCWNRGAVRLRQVQQEPGDPRPEPPPNW